MKAEIVYMLGVIAVGFAVNYALRALPFLLFAGKNRRLPRWIEILGGYVSPVIIGALIVYSYSGLAWKTAWPYLAGVITVAIHLWKRNPLVSIVAGTVVYMCLLTTGCASRPALVLDSEDPSVSVSALGIKIGNNLVRPQDVVEALKDNDIPKTRVVHILLEPEVRDMREARNLMAYLCMNGYTRPVLVTRRHSESRVVEKTQAAPTRATTGTAPSRAVARPRQIRYKSANE